MPRMCSHNFRTFGAAPRCIPATPYFRASSTSAWNAGSPLVLNKPAGVVDGDIMVTLVGTSNTSVPDSVPAGWALVASTSVPTENRGLHAYQRTASSEGASYSWGTVNAIAGGILAYQNVTTAATISRANTTSTGTVSVPADANAVARRIILYVSKGRWFSAGTQGPTFLVQPADGSNAVERYKLQDSALNTGREFIMAYDALQMGGVNFPAYTAEANTVTGSAVRAGFIRFSIFTAN